MQISKVKQLPLVGREETLPIIRCDNMLDGCCDFLLCWIVGRQINTNTFIATFTSCKSYLQVDWFHLSWSTFSLWSNSEVNALQIPGLQITTYCSINIEILFPSSNMDWNLKLSLTVTLKQNPLNSSGPAWTQLPQEEFRWLMWQMPDARTRVFQVVGVQMTSLQTLWQGFRCQSKTGRSYLREVFIFFIFFTWNDSSEEVVLRHAGLRGKE